MSSDSSDGWLRIHEPPRGITSSKQEAAIREFARTEYGYKNLRGFASFLRSMGWTYYDIIQEKYR